MKPARIHPYTALRIHFQEGFSLPNGHVVTLNNSNNSLTTYDLAAALSGLQSNIDASAQDASNKIASTNSSIDTTNANVADVKKIATTAYDQLENGIPTEILADLRLKLIGPEPNPPDNPDNIAEGRAWPRVAFYTLDTYNSRDEALNEVSKKFLFGKQMQLMSVNDWPFSTAYLGQTWWADAANPCCAKVGYGYKKKDGYIKLDDTNNGIFGVATYKDANPALCWIDYPP